MIDTIELRVHGILEMKEGLISKETGEWGMIPAIPEHHELYKKMLTYKGRFFDIVKTMRKETTSKENFSSSEFLGLENDKNPKGLRYIQNIVRFQDAKLTKELIMRSRGKYNVDEKIKDTRIPSSVSEVNFSINEQGGFIDFNISIPKYLYGHSLAEFIPQIHSKRYINDNSLFEWSKQKKIVYSRFIAFINQFNKDLKGVFKLKGDLNKNYIEVRRIDLCYNQYFESKPDALNYLSHQKKLVKEKRLKLESSKGKYETSLTVMMSKGCYFKIYHKGTEYSKSNGDLKKHSDYNKLYLDYHLENSNTLKSEDYREKLKDKDYIHDLFKESIENQNFDLTKKLEVAQKKLISKQYQGKTIKKGWLKKREKEIIEQAKIIQKIQPYKIKFLKKEMDKVLRYEVTLRSDFFGYNYKTKIFRRKCKKWKKVKGVYNYVHKAYHTNKGEDLKVNRDDLREYKMLHDFYNRSIALTLSTAPIFQMHQNYSGVDYHEIKDKYNLTRFPYKYSLLSTHDVGIFNEDFLKVCFTKFKSLVDGFQISELDKYDTVAERIKQYNLDVNDRVEEYNGRFGFLIKLPNNKWKGNQRVTKATQLLTQGQKRELRLKRVNANQMLFLLHQMESGKSLRQIRINNKIPSSTFSRYKKDLDMFGIYENSINTNLEYKPATDFKQYYYNTGSLEYQDKIFLKSKFKRYG